jgi:hypothetical protein
MRRDRSTRRRISRLGMVHTAAHAPEHAPRGELGRYARIRPLRLRLGRGTIVSGRVELVKRRQRLVATIARRVAVGRSVRFARLAVSAGSGRLRLSLRASRPVLYRIRLSVPGDRLNAPCAVRFRVCARERLLGARALYVAAARQAELGRACRWRPHPRPPHRRLDRPARSLHRPPHGGGLRLLVRPGLCLRLPTMAGQPPWLSRCTGAPSGSGPSRRAPTRTRPAVRSFCRCRPHATASTPAPWRRTAVPQKGRFRPRRVGGHPIPGASVARRRP